MIKNILLDLDGTLVDSAEGILSSVEYAFAHLGDPVPPRKDLMCFIGPPLEVSFHEFFHMPMEKARRAVELYRENYTPKGIYEFTVYPGVEEMLKELKEAGFTLALATSKPEVFAKRILEKAGLSGYFSAVCGSLLPKGRDDKNEVIDYLMEKEGYCPGETVMIGDRFYDIEGAHACGIPAMGVLYGFGNREEMEEAKAEMICESPREATLCLLAPGERLCGAPPHTPPKG